MKQYVQCSVDCLPKQVSSLEKSTYESDTESFQTQSSVEIACDMGGGTTYGGTGTVIACKNGISYILTCAHVVLPAALGIKVNYLGKDRRRNQSVATYVGGFTITQSGDVIQLNGPDLALISIKVELPVISITQNAPNTDDLVHQYGYGSEQFGSAPVLETGKVVQLGTVGVLNSTIQSVDGDSGSGVINSKGQLVGVCFGFSQYSYAISASIVQTFVNSLIQ